MEKTPLRSNWKRTEPGVPKLPPHFSKMCRISGVVRLPLSVIASTMIATPPPRRAATVISLGMRVKILPRLASAAPFLCLMVLHLLWPDIGDAPLKCGVAYAVFGGDDYNRVPRSRGYAGSRFFRAPTSPR